MKSTLAAVPVQASEGFTEESTATTKIITERIDEEEVDWAAKGLGLCKNGTLPKGLLKAFVHSKGELVRGICRGIGVAVVFNGGLKFIWALLRTRSLTPAWNAALGEDSRRFALFLGAFVGSFRFLNALLASLRGKDHQENSLVAGFVAGYTCVIDSPSRRQSLALILLVRAVEIVLKRLGRLGELPNVNYVEEISFGISNMPIMYSFLFDPSLLDPSYYNWILSMGNLKDEALYITGREVRDARRDRGVILPFRPCSCAYHQGRCPHYLAMDWFQGLLRASKIYIPVHLIPIVLFRLRQIGSMDSAKLIAQQYIRNLAQSCFFLSTYVLVVKSNMCFWRNLLKADHSWTAMLAGLMTGFACLFERKSRVAELMLFCWPKGLQATYRFLWQRGLISGFKKGEIPIFAASTAVLLASRRDDYKQTYFNLLKLIIGN